MYKRVYVLSGLHIHNYVQRFLNVWGRSLVPYLFRLFAMSSNLWIVRIGFCSTSRQAIHDAYSCWCHVNSKQRDIFLDVLNLEWSFNKFTRWLIWHKCQRPYTNMNCPSCVVVVVCVVTCEHSSRPQLWSQSVISCIHMHICPKYMHVEYFVNMTHIFK